MDNAAGGAFLILVGILLVPFLGLLAWLCHWF